MMSAVLAIGVPLFKFILSLFKKEKLSDKQFVAAILAHQSKKSQAGKTALDFEAAMEKAMNELDEAEKNNKLPDAKNIL